ncbi:hypothetical protein ABZW18_06125 [Streptomyces sp. NPDC004647]|uniref:hypothetical protein n=1 Tax=Streptomyces sp. NPDC004647 TaxID=3154671 RepID=UPI0033BB19B4
MRPAQRLTWHPATAAALITAAAVAGVAAALPLSTAGTDGLWPWLVTGAAAGFATSGST